MSNRFALRAYTHADHGRLDVRASRLDLSQPAGYRDFLLWHAGIVPALERHLEHNGIARLLADWPQRSRRAALLADLAALGAKPFPLSHTLGTSGASDPGNAPAALWGIAYVLEGSRLGSTLLRKRIPPQFRANAARYLSHGQDDRLWVSFSQALDRQTLSPAALKEAGEAARAVFTLFTAALQDAVQPMFHKTG